MALINGQLTINKKDYLLRYDINTLCEMSNAGLDVMTIDEGFDFVTLRQLIFYGLQKFHKKEVTTLEVAGELISDFLEAEGTLDELSQALANAINRALGVRVASEGK